MKAARLHAFHEALTLEEVPDPQITSPMDVIVRIGAAGLCRTDLHIWEGQFDEVQKEAQLSLPYSPGHENAGWVEAVGEAVTNVAPGDKVILHPLVTCGLCRACRAGDDVHCENSSFPGLSAEGGFAQYLKTGGRSVIKMDPSLEPTDVAPLADAGLTAYHAVRKAVPLLFPGTRVVVIGAGGLGHIGIQVLKAISPAELIVVDRNPDAVKLALSIGADSAVVADGSQVEQVMELTGGHGAEAVIDFVGEGGSTKQGIAMTRRAGDYLVVGYGENVDVPTIDLISTEINVLGNLVGSYNDLVELMALAAQQKVTLHTAKYALDDFQSAIDDLDGGRVRGRAILVP